MPHNAGFKFALYQRYQRTAKATQPPDSPQGAVRVLMRDGKWLVQPGERPALCNDGSSTRSSSE
jgi:hypothetical protein